MPDPTDSPTFPTGARARDRVTGETYTVTGPSFVTGYTSVRFDAPDDDGCRTGDVPTDDLEPMGAADDSTRVASAVRDHLGPLTDDVLRAAATLTYWPGRSVPVAPFGVLLPVVRRVQAVAL